MFNTTPWMQRLSMAASVAVASCMLVTATPVQAQSPYPNRPIKLVAPFPPGGTSDVLSRVIAKKLGEALGQPITVDNKPGASGNIGTDTVAKAAPDGYTLLQVVTPNAINQALYSNLGFDFIRDIAPVGGILRVPNVMVVNNDVPAKTVKEFIDYAKVNPGKVNMASSGNGTSVHLSGELFMAMTGVKAIAHLPSMTSLRIYELFFNQISKLRYMTGGAGWKMAPSMSTPIELVDSLIFDGLLEVASRRFDATS